jgi:tetratricopeptide (TPR) repeat protein
MRTHTCHNCAAEEVPQNESLFIEEQPHCKDCVDQHYPTQEALAGKKAVKVLDPTVCAECHTDYGSVTLPTLGQYPVCDSCQRVIKEKTFPLWVKGFLAGIALIVVFSFFWNWKYYSAYRTYNDGIEIAKQGDYGKAATKIKEASLQVPDATELATLANFYEGYGALINNQSEKALNCLTKCEGKLPEDFKLTLLLLQAKTGTAFDHHDYKGFLSGCQESLALDSTQVGNWMGMASAYSCLYVAEGQEDYKVKALEHIARAKQLDSTSAEAKEYYNMIDYRLTQHQIITRDDFKKQFPHGWTKP